MSNVFERSLVVHKELEGKIEITLKAPIDSLDQLSLLYSPGVAQPCLDIAKEPSLAYDYTWKGNTIAVVSDGSAVLGLGNIGAAAALPVMEGKAALLKQFAGVNAVPLVIDTQDTEAIIEFCRQIAPGFGGINLEDISSPRCIEIEQRLDKELDIPVFHDDQHGTAIVCVAGLMNALKLVDKTPESIKVVLNGTGAAGYAIIKLLKEFGVEHITAFNSKGHLNTSQLNANPVLNELIALTGSQEAPVTFEEAFVGADVFIGVSVADVVSEAMVQSMSTQPIIFAMANPNPEITYDKAKAAGAFVVGTGRSDCPNQINNVLVFPGLFKGLLASRATYVPTSLKLEAARAIAALAPQPLTSDAVVPPAFDERVADHVAQAVVDCVVAMREEGINI